MKASLIGLGLALGLAGGAAACDAVTLTLELSQHQPLPGHSLHAVGNLPVLGPWHPREGNRFEPQADGRWLLRLALPPDTAFEFKLLQSGPDGAPVWESHQLTPTFNRHARSPRCGQEDRLVLPRFEQLANPWDLLRSGARFRDRPLVACGPSGVAALAAALQSRDPEHRAQQLQQAVDPVSLPLAPLQARLDELLAQTGALRVVSQREVDGLDPVFQVLMVRAERFGQLLPVVLRVDAVGRLTGLGWPHPALRIGTPPEAPLDRVGLREQARQLVEQACRDGHFSGAIELAERGQALFSQTCGVANHRYDVPNHLLTRFNLASLNKMFTAVAVLQAAEQGRLSLDDTLDQHLAGDWLPREQAARISLRQLLTHRSGLGSYFSDAFFQSARDRFSVVADYRWLVKDMQPAFAPGAHFAYSNAGYLLLGAVLERRGAGDYFAQVQRQVFDPAGMVGAGHEPMNVPVPQLAMHYAPGRAGGWIETTWSHVYRAGPAGGGYARVNDLTQFAAALLAGRLLSPASLSQAWPRDGSTYGMGFELGQSTAGFVVGHSGGFPGINAQLDLYPDRGFSVAVLSNVDGTAASQLAVRLGELLARLPR